MSKGSVSLIIPGLLAVLGIIVDNGLRWRSEMEYREYDRQTRLLENIMQVERYEERKALIRFYLAIEAFNHPVKEKMIAYVKAPEYERPVPISGILPSPTVPQKPTTFNSPDLTRGLQSLRNLEAVGKE